MNIKHSLLIAVTSLSALTAANAQEKVEVKVTGRALFDAATYSQNDAAKTQDGTMNDGIGIRDMRIGFKAYYGDNWYFRGDASFTNNKVSLKDVSCSTASTRITSSAPVTTPCPSVSPLPTALPARSTSMSPRQTSTSQAVVSVLCIPSPTTTSGGSMVPSQTTPLSPPAPTRAHRATP